MRATIEAYQCPPVAGPGLKRLGASLSHRPVDVGFFAYAPNESDHIRIEFAVLGAAITRSAWSALCLACRAAQHRIARFSVDGVDRHRRHGSCRFPCRVRVRRRLELVGGRDRTDAPTWVIAILVIAAGAGFAVWALFLSPIKAPAATTQSDVAVEVFGLGTIEARVESKVGFKVAGVLVDLRADVGDRVPKGDVLARLDDREQAAQVARAKAAVAQTRPIFNGQGRASTRPRRTLPMRRA